MTEHEVRLLLQKYNRGDASKEERILLERWYFTQFEQQAEPNEDLDLDKLKSEIWQGTLNRSGIKSSKNKGLRSLYSVAAAIILLMGIGVYFYLNSLTPVQTYTVAELSQQDTDIKPGKNQARLTLADGRIIDLADEKGGIIIDTDALVYTDGTKVADSSPVSSGSEILSYNTIATPKGGQYQVILPDGSRVWLNAASTLRYPSRFDTEERVVELSGEAYFEIAQIKLSDQKTAKPFIVKSQTQEVQVLGTHFNVNTYDDDATAITTLLEGAVNVRSSIDSRPLRLKPGQQSVVQPGSQTQVRTADLEEAIGWKNGEFIFYNERIEKVMNDIARWYDVEVIYQGAVRDKMIWGSVSKFETISEVLKMIELAGTVHFDIQIQGDKRRVYVMN